MHLQIKCAEGGRPNCKQQALSCAIVGGERRIAVATGYAIDICNARLNLQYSIDFCAVSDPEDISCAVSAVLLSPTGLLIASAKNRVTVWNTTSSERFEVHSALETAGTVHCISYTETRSETQSSSLPPTAWGTIITAANNIEAWQMQRTGGIQTWCKAWSIDIEDSTAGMDISHDGTLLAAFAPKSSGVYLWKIDGVPVQELSCVWHPAAVISVSWKKDSHTLFTQDAHGAFRIWATMIDEPDSFVLWATLNPACEAPTGIAPRSLASYWLERDAQLSSEAKNQPTSYVWTIFENGSLGITAVRNVSRVPPTCVEQSSARVIAECVDVTHLSCLRHSYLFCDSATGETQIVGHDGAGSMLSMSFRYSSLQPSIEIHPNRPGACVTALACAPSADMVWRLDRSGGIALQDASSLVVQASTFIASVRSVCALDSARAVVATPHKLVMLNRLADKLICVAEIETPVPVVHLRRSDADTIATIDEQNRFTWYTISAGSLRMHGNLALDQDVLAVFERKHGIATFDRSGQLSWSNGRVLRTCRYHTVAAALSPSLYLAVLDRKATQNTELTIWDTTESEFARGLLYSGSIDASASSLAWLSVESYNDALAVLSADSVCVFHRARRRYFSDSPTWSVLAIVSFVSLTRSPLSAFTWLPSGNLLAASSRSLFAVSFDNDKCLPLYLQKSVGPLPLCHPQLLQQALLAGKIVGVIRVLSAIAKHIRQHVESGNLQSIEFELDPTILLSDNDTEVIDQSRRMIASHDALTTRTQEDLFAENDVETIEHALAKTNIVGMNQDDCKQLALLARIALYLDAQKRALDMNGMRFLVALRAYALRPVEHVGKKQLHFRDVLWAYHSRTQEILIQASSTAETGILTWENARSLGIFQWLRSPAALAEQMEIVARHTYSSSENRDPIPCQLFYFALRKRKLVLGLWKQAVGHPDRNNMLKFLANNFEEQKWQVAARKNAFSLLGKQRFVLAASFFLLGDSVKDAVNVCLRNLEDFQLAVAIARVYENGNGPILHYILEHHIIPFALGNGHRWLASWAFWQMERRDLAVQVIVTPFSSLLPHLPFKISRVEEPSSDDPALALLFAELRGLTLQTIRGATFISARVETAVRHRLMTPGTRLMMLQFVLYMARILREMGCHFLALDLVSSWTFAPPLTFFSKAVADSDSVHTTRPRPARRRPSLLDRRHSSVIADLQVPSTVVSRAPTPEPPISSEIGEREVVERLAKQNKKQAAQVADFDPSAFGF